MRHLCGCCAFDGISSSILRLACLVSLLSRRSPPVCARLTCPMHVLMKGITSFWEVFVWRELTSAWKEKRPPIFRVGTGRCCSAGSRRVSAECPWYSTTERSRYACIAHLPPHRKLYCRSSLCDAPDCILHVIRAHPYNLATKSFGGHCAPPPIRRRSARA